MNYKYDGVYALVITLETYLTWGNSKILHDEDDWCGKYKTYGEMWHGEGYTVVCGDLSFEA